MRLENVEMQPAAVVEDNDPKYLGRVKVCCLGKSDTDTMRIEDMHWAYPLFPFFGVNGFSRLTHGTKVWLIDNKENYNEYWYMPYFEPKAISYENMNNDDKYNGDVVISRTNGVDNVELYANDEDGLKQSIGAASIQIMPTGDIYISTGKSPSKPGKLHVHAETVELGDDNGNKRQCACMGENIHSMINEVTNQLDILAKMSLDGYASYLYKFIINVSEAFKKYIKNDELDIRAKHVTIN